MKKVVALRERLLTIKMMKKGAKKTKK